MVLLRQGYNCKTQKERILVVRGQTKVVGIKTTLSEECSEKKE